jgi:hypothetical protein
MCFHGSKMATQSVDVVGYSALNFADAAHIRGLMAQAQALKKAR